MQTTAMKRIDLERHRLLIKHNPASKWTLDKHSKMPNYITHGLVHKKEWVNKQAVKILREKTDLKMASTGSYCRSAVWRPCGVTLHATLQNKSIVCSGSQVTNSTVMKLHESDWLMIAYIALFSALLSRLTALVCGSVRSFVLFLLNVLRCQKHIRDNL